MELWSDGKSVTGSLQDYIKEEKDGPSHIIDAGHMAKNAEAALERGIHFDGKYSYDATDLAVMMSTVDESLHQKLLRGVSHKAVMQFD